MKGPAPGSDQGALAVRMLMDAAEGMGMALENDGLDREVVIYTTARPRRPGSRQLLEHGVVGRHVRVLVAPPVLIALCAKCGARVASDLAVEGADWVETAIAHFWERHPGEEWELVTDDGGKTVYTELPAHTVTVVGSSESDL